MPHTITAVIVTCLGDAFLAHIGRSLTELAADLLKSVRPKVRIKVKITAELRL